MRRMTWPVLLLLVCSACVTRGPEGPVTPTTTVTREEVEVPQIPVAPAPDLSPLAGRRLFIDPGHGGPWPGAVAPSNGLRESDVNLRVAMELARLAQGAGAQVMLSRVDDTAPVPDSPSADLSARAQMGNDSGAETFISVHHNADITPGSQRNDLEVYYKLGDAAGSLDLGQAMTYELAYRLRRDAPAKLLLPGNYKVLRESRLPSVLLESSYMTHAGNAALMATDEGVKAEALAIAAGLARYFSLDPPAVASAELAASSDLRTHQIVARFSRGLPIDTNMVRVSLGNEELAGQAAVSGPTLRYTFQEPLPNGDLRFEVRVRNDRGAATSFPLDSRVDRPVQSVAVEQHPLGFSGSVGAELLYAVRVEDALGLPVADGTVVTLETTGATAATRGGVARFYLPVGSANTLSFVAGDVHATISPDIMGPAFRSIRVVDAVTNAPVPRALVHPGGTTVVITTEEGWAALPAEMAEISIERRGYERAEFALQAPHELLPLTPRFNGALHGKRIVVDPAYGGRNAGAIGPLGTRASDVNLDVAQRAAAQLREAGAEVLMTRTDDSDPSEMRRVEMADEFEADIFVSVSYGGPGSSNRALDAGGHLRDAGRSFVGHYPGSPNGTRLAQGIAQALGIGTVTPSVAYVVQQTASPAVLVQSANVADADTEQALGDAKARQSAAEGLARGVVSYFTGVQ